jgi:hypothetical protein
MPWASSSMLGITSSKCNVSRTILTFPRGRTNSTQLCIPTCRSGSSLAARCLFALQFYRCICGAIIAQHRTVNGDDFNYFWAGFL